MSIDTDIPLYDIIQELEKKWGEKTHMVIDAFIDDGDPAEENAPPADLKSVPENLLFWCEFQDQVKVFDNLASAKHWFLEEVEYKEEYDIINNNENDE